MWDIATPIEHEININMKRLTWINKEHAKKKKKIVKISKFFEKGINNMKVKEFQSKPNVGNVKMAILFLFS